MITGHILHIKSEMNHANRVADELKKTFLSVGPYFYNELRDLLIETGSVIAGGFVLGAINNKLDESSDIDIYTPYLGYQKMLDFLHRNTSTTNCVHFSSAYDLSFFKRNGILVRFSFQIGGRSVDLLILKEGRKVLDVVRSFDLTFCEVWFDGVRVNGTNIDDALKYKGMLRKEYAQSLFEGNVFTLGRMAKYHRRSYTITIEIGFNGEVYNDNYPFDADHLLTTTLLGRLYGRYPMIFRKYPQLITSDFGQLIKRLDEIATDNGSHYFVLKCVNTLVGFFRIKKSRYHADQTMMLINSLMDQIPIDKQEMYKRQYSYVLKEIQAKANHDMISNTLFQNDIHSGTEYCTWEEIDSFFSFQGSEVQSSYHKYLADA